MSDLFITQTCKSFVKLFHKLDEFCAQVRYPLADHHDYEFKLEERWKIYTSTFDLNEFFKTDQYPYCIDVKKRSSKNEKT